jgi:hypothetical protein
MGQHTSRMGEKNKHENLKERDHLEYLSVYGGIILKRVFCITNEMQLIQCALLLSAL